MGKTECKSVLKAQTAALRWQAGSGLPGGCRGSVPAWAGCLFSPAAWLVGTSKSGGDTWVDPQSPRRSPIPWQMLSSASFSWEGGQGPRGQQQCNEGLSSWETADGAACKCSHETPTSGETGWGSITGSLERCSKREHAEESPRTAVTGPAVPRSALHSSCPSQHQTPLGGLTPCSSPFKTFAN